MTSKNIKNMILNYEMTEDLLWEYLEIDFNNAIIGVTSALNVLVIDYNKNMVLINDILSSLELIAKKSTNIDSIKIFHLKIKELVGNVFKHFKEIDNCSLKMIIRRLQDISKYLKQKINDDEASKKIGIIETIINDKNLKIISNLIRDNKDILKIKDGNNENILYKLLKKYSYCSDNEEINYLYQVISLFINNDDLNIEITKNIDYYISALKNRSVPHVVEMIRLLNTKSKPIDLETLENRFGIHLKYPENIEIELNARRIRHNGAIDFRDKEIFTIDGEGTECLDDAIYMERNSDGTYTLYVSDTYIPSLIPYLSKMNRESIRRMETYYLTDGAYTLYPGYISNYKASLLEGYDRYTQTGIWQLDPNMNIIEETFRLVKSTIKSQHRLTYEGADIIIGSRDNTKLCEMLTDLGRFALKQRRKNKIKEEYRRKENEQSNNPNHESRLVDVSVSANIVQECALLFGKSKAEYYKKHGLPYIYRACGEVKKMDLDSKLIQQYQINQREISSMIAYYSSTPEVHAGLGYDVYCHGGSPARRSPDGQNQYIDEDLIFNPNFSDKTVYIWEDRTKRLAQHFNEMAGRIDTFSNQYNYLEAKKLIRKH